MLGNVFKAYDVRGVYPSPLTDKMGWQIGYGASQFLRQDAEAAGQTHPMMQTIVVGQDMRESSPTLTDKLCDGITDQGGNVIRVGLVDTPFVYFAINTLGLRRRDPGDGEPQPAAIQRIQNLQARSQAGRLDVWS